MVNIDEFGQRATFCHFNVEVVDMFFLTSMLTIECSLKVTFGKNFQFSELLFTKSEPSR